MHRRPEAGGQERDPQVVEGGAAADPQAPGLGIRRRQRSPGIGEKVDRGRLDAAPLHYHGARCRISIRHRRLGAATASSPAENPAHPTQILATVYHALGIDPHTMVMNHLNQPRELVKGKIVADLWS